MSDETSKNLPVTLKFQVGSVQIPLQDLLRLSEGMVIEGEPLYTYFPKVRAIYNDQPLYEGELVKVDEKIAFRITKIL